jgi:hypothetical protein
LDSRRKFKYSKRSLAGAGTQTAGFSFWWICNNSLQQLQKNTMESAWTNSTSMATARSTLAKAGTQTAGLGFGGFTTTVVANTEEYTGAFDTVTASTLTTS